MAELRSNLKYLSVLTNTSEIDRDKHRELMDFLRIHYNNLQGNIHYSKKVR